MPQVAVIAAAYIGQAVLAVTSSATLAAAAANAVAALGFAQGVTAAVSAWATVASVASLARGKPRVGGAGSPVDFKADPNAGIPYGIGETGLGGNIVFANTAEAKNAHLVYLTVHSLGPVDSITEFRVNDATVTFSADNAVGFYHNMMWERRQVGSLTPATFYPPATTLGSFVEWTSAHKLTGLAAHWWVLEYDKTGKTYPTGTPKPLTIGKWVKCYDPRLDSTYPGGSGSHRSNDEGTWAWTDNPFLHALTWSLGRLRTVSGKVRRVAGIGAAVALIDVAAFVEGANVCDANGWKAGGLVTTADDKWQVLGAMLQAGGGWPASNGTKISCGVSAPKVSLATLTGDDQADGEVSIDAARSRRERFNAVIPRYRSAAHGYEVVAADKIVVSAYLTADLDRDRTCEPEFFLCPDVDQAAQLGTYAVANSREFGPIVIPCKPRWWGYKPGDCITVDEAEWGLVAQPCLIMSRERDPSTGRVTLTLQTETDAKHAFCLGKTGTAPPSPSLTGINAGVIEAPGAGAFTLSGGTYTSSAGAIPAVTLEGICDNEHAVELLVRYRPTGSTDWAGPIIATLPPFGDEVRVEITGVTSGTQYDAESAYRSPRGVLSDWTSEGTATAGTFTLAALDALIGDGLLTPGEKRTLVPSINALIAARTALRLRADDLGLTTGTSSARAAYETAATNLDAYLATLTSAVAWNNSAGNTTISSPSTFRTRYEDAQKTETDLQSAVDQASKSLIDTAISDGVLTPAEKRQLIPLINALIANRTALRTEATALNLLTSNNLERLAYETAATNLDSYLATLTSAVAWNNSSGNTTISSPSTFKTRLEDAQKVEGPLRFQITTAYGTKISDITTRVVAVEGAVSDGELSKSEKLQVIPTINSLIFARAALRTRATAMGLTVGAGNAERIAFENAASAWDTYLATLTSPVAWNNTTDKTTISSPSNFRTKWEDAYKTTFDLQTKIDGEPTGGAFGVNLTESAGGTTATNVNYKTILGPSSGFVGQTAWATFSASGVHDPNYVAGQLQWQDFNGRATDHRALPVNVAIGFAGGRVTWSLAATASSITVTGYTEYRTGANISVVTGTASGLSADTLYDVFYFTAANSIIAVDLGISYLYKIDISNYVFLGRQQTQASGGGGVYTPPPPPPAGSYGGGSSNPLVHEP